MKLNLMNSMSGWRLINLLNNLANRHKILQQHILPFVKTYNYYKQSEEEANHAIFY